MALPFAVHGRVRRAPLFRGAGQAIPQGDEFLRRGPQRWPREPGELVQHPELHSHQAVVPAGGPQLQSAGDAELDQSAVPARVVDSPQAQMERGHRLAVDIPRQPRGYKVAWPLSSEEKAASTVGMTASVSLS